jgi:hypothetical protein
MTEAQWQCCTDPLRMPKLHRDISTPRKCVLLMCAYALHSPGVFRAETPRRIIEAMQAATARSTSSRELLSAALHQCVTRFIPEFSSNTFVAEWTHRPEFGGEGGHLSWFLCICVKWPSTGTVNDIAAMYLRVLRQNAEAEVQRVLSETFDKHGRTVTDALKEDVFALIPEPEREQVRREPWQTNGLPKRVRNRVYAAVGRPRVAAASAAMADLVREVFGNPFRPPVINPAWLTWNSGTVRHIAESIASTGSFGDMPILADALEDAGCADEELLRHCREERTHVPGCWALDLILGRK